MDGTPPPVPARPGRAVQSIDTIRTETRPNDYVDSTSFTTKPFTPKLPPRVHKEKPADPKASINKDNEVCENLNNELRENHRQKVQNATPKSPPLPPRSDTKAPPVPHRTQTLHSPNTQAPLPPRTHTQSSDLTRISSTEAPSRLNMSESAHLHPTAVLILSQPTSSFLPLRLIGRTTPRQQTLPSNVTLSIDKRTGALTNSIICSECGQCRCSSCTADRPLPERWLCEGNCRCSADTVVDIASCMCCMRPLFRHCCDNHETASPSDPCDCSPSPNCLLRWTGMTALSLCLPCLCCYWPMQGGIAVATSCYNSNCCRRKGCSCSKD